MAEYPIILGVYSHRRGIRVGTGTTKAQHTKVTYWFARQLEQDNFDVQPLNIYHVPSGLRESVPSEKFLAEYTPEPSYYQVNTVPALKSLYEKVTKGEEYLKDGDLDAAEKEFIKALMIDDLNVQANYGLGEVYTEKNEFEKLLKVLKVLMGLEDAFNLENRERLNSFGVKLRKNGHYDQAASFLEKALEINQDDDHIMFNLARVHFDKKDYENCKKRLTEALELNPDFLEARKFLNYCNQVAAGGASG
ncbi:MAG: tetratricopeptide repeat protein [Desulfovibrio sp.]|nr:tetratricopeptide repeat protein [Desulfovibrio sp.]MBI4959575.1 tetratricopeptide repeat protein [Desulfovibrio sp.]